jgi:hypothetical protein
LQQEKLQSTSLHAGNKRALMLFLKSPYLQQERAEKGGDKTNQEAESEYLFWVPMNFGGRRNKGGS